MSVDVAQLLRQAEALARAGRVREAYDVARRATEARPPTPAALHAAGWCALQLRELDAALDYMTRAAAAAPSAVGYCNDVGIVLAARKEPARAEEWYRKALALEPRFPAALLNLGNSLRDQRQWDDAVRAYRAAAEADPKLPAAHHALGTALREVGRVDDALRSYRRALELKPGAAEIYNDLGVTLARAGQPGPAAEALRKAVALQPGYVKPLRNLGTLLLETGAFADAAQVLRQWVAIEPQSPKAHHDLGAALARLGNKDEAMEHLRRTTALAPDYGPAYCNLALVLEDLKKIPEAVEALRQAQKLLPQSRIVEYHLAALGGGESPAACPPDYLVELFDTYAERFDEHLVERLEYRGPQLLWEAVNEAGVKPPVDVIDLGCGTGLCGVLFRPVARTLVGVDLSPRMIDKSRHRGVYTELLREDLVPAVRSRPLAFDVALAADVFIYVGDLREVFAATAAALRPGGLFAFTIETVPEGEYVLRESRRYAQSTSYIKQLAQRHSFSLVSERQVVIRSGEGPPVEGAVITLRR
jgi:predicted TPR repeat methyltransferase